MEDAANIVVASVEAAANCGVTVDAILPMRGE
jgi:hypothetical protein